MALTDAKRRANNKYIRENMTTLGCKMRKDYAEEFKAAADQFMEVHRSKADE